MTSHINLLFAVTFICFFLILTYYEIEHLYINNGQSHTGILPLPFKKRMQSESHLKKTNNYCMPHADLEKKLGLPGPCDDSMFVLDCPDPSVEYLHDPEALNSCGFTNNFRLPKRRKKFIKIPGITDCPERDEVLISDSSLPTSPIPQHIPGKVPKIIHYVSLGCNRTFSFANYLSVLSVHRFIQPGRIYFHGDCTPKGPWWQRTTYELPNIYFRQWSRIKLIQGKRPKWIEHETDIIRLQVVLRKKHLISSHRMIFCPIEIYSLHSCQG